MSWIEIAGLVPTDASANDQFGYSVSIYGDTAIVGAYLKDASGGDSGKAYIFTRTNGSWSTTPIELVAPDASGGDWFGWSVAIYGDTAIVGAPYNDASGADSGKAYIFTRTGTTWSTTPTELVAPDASADDQFGQSVSIYGDTAIVGARLKDASGVNSGKAYIFTRSGTSWSQQGPGLVPDDASVSDYFGYSVSIYGDTAIVGAIGKDASGFDSGKAYIFTRSGTSWTQQGPGLVPDDASFFDNFGNSVAIYGDTVIVGAPYRDASGSDSGKAYIFTRSGTSWSQQGPGLVPDDVSADDDFGWSVAIYGDTAIVGALNKDASDGNSGKAYIYTRTGATWSLQQGLVPGDASVNDRFGQSVAIYGDTAIVGTPLRDASGFNSGKAYIFTFEQPSQPGQPEKLTLTEQTDICICSETLCANLSYTGVTESSKVTNIKDDKSIAISFNRQQEVNAVRNRSFASFDDYLRYKQASLKYY